MKNINNFNVDTSDLPKAALPRQYTVEGEEGAEFILQVLSEGRQGFYDFKSKSFSTTFTSTSSLKVKMKGNSYNGSINFPTNAGGDTYTILLITPPDKDTELAFGAGKNSYSTTITQVIDTTLSFTPTTANGDSYQTFSSTGAASVESVASPISTTTVTKALDWDLKNTGSDDEGFGLRLTRQPINTDWYFQTTEVISSNPAGDAVSNNTVIVADLTDIATGMVLVYHKGTTAPSSATTITAINISKKSITFSTSTAFENGETMTLQARGSSVIQKAIGADIDFSTWNANVISAKSAELTKTVRSDASSETINLNGTYGISGGGFVTISGVGVNNLTTNSLQTVSASSAAGSVVMETDQSDNALALGTKLYFTGSTQTVTIANNIVINKNPSSNRTIYLNLDNFITPGISGS